MNGGGWAGAGGDGSAGVLHTHINSLQIHILCDCIVCESHSRLVTILVYHILGDIVY